MAKKQRDPERSDGKPKKIKRPVLPDVGEYEFGSEENVEAAEKYIVHLQDLHSNDPGFEALVNFLKWGRDTVGWKAIGRVVTKGVAAR